jgi:single-stranded DNA-binding protein
VFLLFLITGYQKVILVGGVGAAPKAISFDVPNDEPQKIYNFSLATNKSYQVDGVSKQTTVWHSVSTKSDYYGNHLQPGDKVLVEGELKYWETATSRGTQIIAQKLLVLKKSDSHFKSEASFDETVADQGESEKK